MSKIAVVTGGGSGIGRACAVTLAQHGFHVVVVGRRQAALDETVALMGRGDARTCDITDAARWGCAAGRFPNGDEREHLRRFPCGAWGV